MTAARSIRTLLAALIISLVLVAVSAQPARAAGQLTTTQINAVIGLLQAFDVPQATINTVKGVLQGTNTNTGTDTNTGSATFTATPTSGKAPLTVSFTARNVGSIDFGDGMTQPAPLFFCGESQGCNTTWSPSHIYSAAGTYTAKAKSGGAVLATKVITVSASNSNDCQTNSNSGRGSCEQEDEDEDTDEDEGDDSDEPVYVGPTIVVSYPDKSKGPFDITRDGHYGTAMLVQWRSYNLPAGSKACTYLYNGSTGTSYALPEGANCVGVGTSNQLSTNKGYARVPAGNKYQALVVAYNAAGTELAQGKSKAVFSMEVMDRNSQEKKASRDTVTTDSAGYITVGGSATVPKLYITVLKNSSSVYQSQLFNVVNGRWSYKLTTALAQGTYNIALLDEAGNVLESGSVYLNPSMPKDSTGGISVTTPTLNVTTTPGSLWVSIQGSTGKGCDGKTYTLDYGDGVNATVPMGSGSCQPIFTRSYPYKTAGTYTIYLRAPFDCPSAASCTGVPVISKTITVPGTTSVLPASQLVAALPYLPISFYETMTKVTSALAAVEMAPIYVITDALSEVLFQAGLY